MRSQAAADTLSATLLAVGKALGIEVRTIITDGSQPVGRGIGPAFSKFGARILYPLSKLALWEEAQQFSSTKEYGKKRAA